MKNKSSLFIKGFKHTALITFLSRITGFIRDVFLASFLGAGIHSDIFIIAFKLPNLFRRITAEGALTSALLPIYTLLKEKKGIVFANNFFKVFTFRVIICLTILLAIFEIFMPFIIYLLAPGFANEDMLLNQIILLSRITIFFMPLISIVALLGVVTNISGRFWAIATTPIILNICLIFACFFIKEEEFLKSLPLALATVTAGIFQIIFMIIIIKKFNILKMEIKSTKKQKSEDTNDIKFYIKKTWTKFMPAAFGGGILQINLLVDTILASLLGFGSVSYLYFSDRIAQLPLGIIGIALGTSLLASLSISSAENDAKQFSKQLTSSFKIGLFFSIPSSLVFILFPDIIISVLFERGEFGINEKYQTVTALIAYSIGIPAFIILKSCQPAFLAEGDTKTPMYIGIVMLLLNITLSLILMKYLSHAGIALATSLSSWIGCIIYIIILFKNNKIQNILILVIYSIKIFLMSSIMILVMKLCFYQISTFQIDKTITLFLIVISGLLTYFLTCGFLRYIPQELLKNQKSKL